MSEKFCTSVWHHININNKGHIKPCCIFREGREPHPGEDIFKWYETAYEDVKDKQLQHPGCIVCAKQEEAGIPSRRQWRGNENHMPKNGEGVNYIDMSFGNYCNLKCRMCESRNSTKWISDEKFLVDNGFDIERPIFKLYEMPKERLEQIINYLNNTKEKKFVLEIKGGEPFVTDQFREFVKRLDDKFKNKCKLVVFTNGSGINDEYIDALEEFQELKVHLSIEGTGKLYEYIRGGNIVTFEEAWDTMKNFKKRVPHLQLSASVTVTMYNIFQLLPVREKLATVNSVIDPKVFSSFSFNPSFLNPGILPEKYKKRINLMYQDVQGFEHMLKTLNSFEHSPRLMKKFKEFTELLDEKRKENIFEVAPEFEEIFNEI